MYLVYTGVHVLSCNETGEAVLPPLWYEETFTGFKRLSKAWASAGVMTAVLQLCGHWMVISPGARHTLLDVYTRFDALTRFSKTRRGQNYLRTDRR